MVKQINRFINKTRILGAHIEAVIITGAYPRGSWRGHSPYYRGGGRGYHSGYNDYTRQFQNHENNQGTNDYSNQGYAEIDQKPSRGAITQRGGRGGSFR